MVSQRGHVTPTQFFGAGEEVVIACLADAVESGVDRGLLQHERSTRGAVGLGHVVVSNLMSLVMRKTAALEDGVLRRGLS